MGHEKGYLLNNPHVLKNDAITLSQSPIFLAENYRIDRVTDASKKREFLKHTLLLTPIGVFILGFLPL